MSAEVGQFALILALLLAVVQAVVAARGAHSRGESVLMALGSAGGAASGGVLSTLAFGCLALRLHRPAISRSLWSPSTATPPNLSPYRFAATWGSHEGSMLLWVLILADLWRLASRSFGGTLRETLQARVVGVQGAPGRRIPWISDFHLEPLPAAFDPVAGQRGRSSIRCCRTSGLVLHPPLLYLGYVGLLGGVLFRGRGVDRGTGRCGLGALGAALGAGGLGAADGGNHSGQRLGVL